MKKKSIFLIITWLLILSLILSACNTKNNNQNNESKEVEPNREEKIEPTVPLPEATEPEPTKAEATQTEKSIPEETQSPQITSIYNNVSLNDMVIHFWHAYREGDPRNEALMGIVDEFNATNEYGIIVEAFYQGSASDVKEKVNVGIVTGDIPHVIQADTGALISWDIVGMITDLNKFVSDPLYGLSTAELLDIYQSVLELGVTLDGRRLAWPLSQSVNAMVYNNTWAQELGFDSAPTTPEELKEQLCAAVEANATDDDPDNDGTGGMVWYPNASNFLSFLHAWNGTELNADGTAYNFNTPKAKAVALFINDLRDSGCIFETGSYPYPEQATRKALITLSSTFGLVYYRTAFEDAENDDDWGFLPFPGPDGGKGVVSWIQTLGILKSTPEQELASWLFIKFLTNPENQAKWVEASGYLPTQYSTESHLADYIAENPIYASVLALAPLGQGEPETYPAWASVRLAINDAAEKMYAATSAEELIAILARLTETAAELVEKISE